MNELPNLETVERDCVGIAFSYKMWSENIISLLDTNSFSPVLAQFGESIFDAKKRSEEIKAKLRDILARNTNLRKKDFDNIIQDINALQSRQEKESEIKRALSKYVNDQVLMAQALKDMLEKVENCLLNDNFEKITEYKSLTKKILTSQEERKNEIISKMKKFQEEQHLFTTKLEELLNKGNSLKIKDFKKMQKEFQFYKFGREPSNGNKKAKLSEHLAPIKEMHLQPALQ